MRTKYFITSLLFFTVFIVNAQIDIVTADADSESGIKSNTKQINITNDLYFLQGDEENIGVYLDKEGVLLIDTQSKEEMSRSIRLINRLSKKKPIYYLVNTTGQIKYMKSYLDLKKDGTIILSYQPNYSKEDEYKLKGSSSSVSDITYSNEIALNLINEKVKLIPANNSGSSIVYFTNRNVLFSGDVFLGRVYPLIDAEKGKSYEDVALALSKIIKTIDNKTKIIPGKGDITNLTDASSTKQMIWTIYKQVYSLRENGKTLEQTLATNMCRNYDTQGYGNGTVTSKMFITSIYNEAAKELGPLDTRTPEEKAMERLKEMQKEKKQKENKN